MKSKISILFLLLIFIAGALFSQNKTDANIIGHVVSKGEHLPFVSIAIKGTALGTATDQTGHYRLLHVPVGKITLVASFVGYRTQEIHLFAESNRTLEINFDLEPDALKLDEVIVTGKLESSSRSESSIIINTIDAQLFSNTQSLTLGEGLNYCSGLRLETNCSNCGFSQVRLNGMEGPYSEILINGKAIFSGLAAVYGLELIPASMIDKIEVVRGGGSVFNSGNAIAGSINLRLKEPLQNRWEAGSDFLLNGTWLGNDVNPSKDVGYNFSASVVSDDHQTGLSVFGFNRTREALDVNGDRFTELTALKNTSLGSRIFHRFSEKTKLTLDYFHVSEFRRGGNKLELPEHEADIAESLRHKIHSGGLSIDHFLQHESMVSVFAAGQSVQRDSYYGANQSLADYGETTDFTYNAGIQYKTNLRSVKLSAGFDLSGSRLKDRKKGYTERIANHSNDSIQTFVPSLVTAYQQRSNAAAFFQFEQKINWLSYTAGLRLDHYNIGDLLEDELPVMGTVLSPRINMMAAISPVFQARLSYSGGFRPPQIFDEDLHIEASSARKVIHINAPGLKQETGQSLMASVDATFNKGKSALYLLTEVFYTRLKDPFVNQFGLPDSTGLVVYTRNNARGTASVYGLNTEINWVPFTLLNTTVGFTFQKSIYSEAQDFGERRFLRTPDLHGFFTMDWNFADDWTLALSGTYTGPMLISYFGPALENPDVGELRTSKSFTDLGLKLSYSIKLNTNRLNVYAGIKNVFNAYQPDFDRGADRDPAYVYGPALPRTIYFGMKIGDLL